MHEDALDRTIRFVGREGQERLRATRVAVVGVGGVGTHVVQQLAYFRIGRLGLVDSEELKRTSGNRYVSARHDDPIPGSRKVDLGERLVKAVDPSIVIDKMFDSVVSEEAFAAIIAADVVFGCLDSEGARLVLTELCAAYSRPYIDVASEIPPGERLRYGGEICIAWDGRGCLICRGLLDQKEAERELADPETRRARDAEYGLPVSDVPAEGPAVVSINGVVASLATTEFLVGVTGIRPPKGHLTYRGHTGTVTVSTEPPPPDCYYCTGIRGQREQADVQRYIRAGVGRWLR